MTATQTPAQASLDELRTRRAKRELVEKVVANLPEEFTVFDLVDRILFVQKAQAAMEKYERGDMKTVFHEEAVREIHSWRE